MKKLLLLGGLRYLIPVILEAKKLGLHTITCDYLPNNIAHKYSDEYHNINITDREAVLTLARKLQIDGIMSFAVDPGVITAAFVANKMNLPGNPLRSVEILQNKALFRQFLKNNDFNVPKAKAYLSYQDAAADIDYFGWPIIVKPVDAAGSKGVTRVNAMEFLKESVEKAISNSFSKTFIIEEFIEPKGYASDSDCFSVNGKLQFVSFSSQRFDQNSENPYTPSAYSWPSNISVENQKILIEELQRLITLLNLKTSIYNIEVREGENGLAYIMEVSPRGGGNRLSEMVQYATGVNLIQNAIKAAIGQDIAALEMPVYKGNWAVLILYSHKEGKFEKVFIDESLQKFLVEVDLWIREGDKVFPFSSANHAIGTVVFNFDNKKQVQNVLQNRENLIKVIIF